jgi:hypothetical protein
LPSMKYVLTPTVAEHIFSHSIGFSGNVLSLLTIILIVQHVTPIVSHQLTRPDALGVTHGESIHTNTRKPYYYHRFSE